MLLGWENDELVVSWKKTERLMRSVYALFLGQVVSFLLALSSFFSNSVIDLGKFLFFDLYFGFVDSFCQVLVFGMCRCECAFHP